MDHGFYLDKENTLFLNRKERTLVDELFMSYRIQFFNNFYHPQRECNDMIIYDNEYLSDIQKRLDE